MKEIIVIPDLHGRSFWKEAVDKYPEADTIFLGDYFDPYPEEGISHRATLANFKELLEYARNHRNVTLLFGNHELVYWFPYNWGRKDEGREDEILSLLRQNIDLLRMFAMRDIGGKKWLFSHAPLFEEWIAYTQMPHDLQKIEDRIREKLAAYDRLNPVEKGSWEERRKPHDELWDLLGRASKFRGGIDECGSPVWADVQEVASECKMYRDADYFVFGHTRLNVPIITDTYACLDTAQAYRISSAGEIEAITQKRTPNLPKEKGRNFNS